LLDDDPLRKEIWTHAGAYAAAARVDLVAASDLDAGRLETCGERWAVESLYPDYREMLSEEAPDLVSVCTPPAHHAEVVLAAVEAGVRGVFCEKPLAVSLSEADEVLEAVASRGVALQVNHTRRWDRIYEIALQRISAGDLGGLWSVVGYGDTALFTNAIHLLDMVRYLAGDVREVHAYLQQDNIRMVDGYPDPGAVALLALESGATAFVRSWAHAPHFHQFEVDVWGEKGRLRICNDGRDATFQSYEPSSHSTGYFELSAEVHQDRGPAKERMLLAIEELVDHLETGKDLRCSGEDGKAAMELVFAIHAAAESGGPIRLPLQERAWHWSPEGVKK
jgi:predicted dehydrogenase